jgi:hypothetical protein
MAYVVVRPNGRFEIRESVNTPKGPRARSLANFAVLTDEVLAQATSRATRPFDPTMVLAAADRAGVRVTLDARQASAPGWKADVRRSAGGKSVERRKKKDGPDAGQALIDLLGFAEQVTPFSDPPPRKPLGFPPLAKLAAARPSASQKSASHKSASHKSVSQKSASHKSVSQKSASQKSVSQKSARRS